MAAPKKMPPWMGKEEAKEAKLPAKGKAKAEAKESPAKKKAEKAFGYADGGKMGKKKC